MLNYLTRSNNFNQEALYRERVISTHCYICKHRVEKCNDEAAFGQYSLRNIHPRAADTALPPSAQAGRSGGALWGQSGGGGSRRGGEGSGGGGAGRAHPGGSCPWCCPGAPRPPACREAGLALRRPFARLATSLRGKKRKKGGKAGRKRKRQFRRCGRHVAATIRVSVKAVGCRCPAVTRVTVPAAKTAETGARSSPRGREGGAATFAPCALGADECPERRRQRRGEHQVRGWGATSSLCPLSLVFYRLCSSPAPAHLVALRQWLRRCCPREQVPENY